MSESQAGLPYTRASGVDLRSAASYYFPDLTFLESGAGIRGYVRVSVSAEAELAVAELVSPKRQRVVFEVVRPPVRQESMSATGGLALARSWCTRLALGGVAMMAATPVVGTLIYVWTREEGWAFSVSYVLLALSLESMFMAMLLKWKSKVGASLECGLGSPAGKTSQ